MEIFKRNYLFLDVDVKRKEEAMNFIASKADELGISKDKQQTEEDLWNREKEFNTAIDETIAIPHTKSETINFPAVLIIKLKNSIDWGGENIKLIISFLTPKENKENIHLTMLSKISRKLIDEEFKLTLNQSNDANVVYKLIQNALNS
ncbi:fructose PTS transporter subunit IIA [Irregularibacter muris]|uniref:Fructose PTS transporter subunit IIA n=1 Tax=Irregularibacter muris TaxID=1796619 RepID=A0AAE3HDC6_9FIRM|nr:fructose PTS transporter subunit IIA [Irregularibacter muris]